MSLHRLSAGAGYRYLIKHTACGEGMTGNVQPGNRSSDCWIADRDHVLHRLNANSDGAGAGWDDPAAAANRILAGEGQPAGRRRNRPVSWHAASAQRGRAAGITFVDRINAQLSARTYWQSGSDAAGRVRAA
jgi:hypothetical protein